jgi:hypothetical protein
VAERWRGRPYLYRDHGNLDKYWSDDRAGGVVALPVTFHAAARSGFAGGDGAHHGRLWERDQSRLILAKTVSQSPTVLEALFARSPEFPDADNPAIAGRRQFESDR